MKDKIEQAEAKFLVSGEYPARFAELEKWGVHLIYTTPDQRLPKPVQYHPDLQVCRLSFETLFVLKNSSLLEFKNELCFQSPKVLETETEPEAHYPKDVLCSGVPFGKWLLANPHTLDPLIMRKANEEGLSLIPVRQGYAACAVCKVGEHAAITADEGICRALQEKKEFEVLLIQPGFIELPGYDTGFLGGCCGKLEENLIVFTGALSCHPDGKKIKDFLNSHQIDIWELSRKPLLDTGGIIEL